MAAELTINKLTFVPWIKEETVLARVKELAAEISAEYRDKNPLFISILNGSFVFSSDLMRNLDFHMCNIEFCRVSSYEGMESTGDVKTLIGLKLDLTDRHVIFIEDIVDTGTTMHSLMKWVMTKNPASVKLATLFLKPASLKVDVKTDFVGFKIPSKFILGYGLDIDEYARNLKDVWVLKEHYSPSYAIEDS